MFNQAHGIEVLLRKAAVDPAFRDLLLRRRADAAGEIGLALTAAERGILTTVPDSDLLRMIGKIEVPEAHRTVFRGRTAAAMLAIVVGAGVIAGCAPAVTGIRPKEEAGEDHPEATEPDQGATSGTGSGAQWVGPSRGIRPDPVEPKETPEDPK